MLFPKNYEPDGRALLPLLYLSLCVQLVGVLLWIILGNR